MMGEGSKMSPEMYYQGMSGQYMAQPPRYQSMPMQRMMSQQQQQGMWLRLNRFFFINGKV